jgi:Holliday junction DNA helicase RuvA
MIATLNGVVSEKTADQIILEVQGVGYNLLTTAQEHGQLQIGATVKLYVHEHIREDAHDLYGFSTPDTKALFEQLLSVKNVGPKVALAVLSIGAADRVRSAIASGDVKLLQSAKGVGKRAAEQMVVELRDKVGLVSSQDAENLITRGGVSLDDEAAQALLALGYTEADAQSALQSIDPKLSTEERIKLALRSSH